jgi:hypothetical protein
MSNVHNKDRDSHYVWWILWDEEKTSQKLDEKKNSNDQ